MYLKLLFVINTVKKDNSFEEEKLNFYIMSDFGKPKSIQNPFSFVLGLQLMHAC